jgi:hypothetical protein
VAGRGGGGVFVTSITKLVVLYLATFGLYGVYWFAAHWQEHKRAFGANIWPVLRGIFSIFFATQLFKSIDLQARQAGLSPSWNPGSNAGIYIALVVGARVMSRLDQSAGVSALGLIAMAVGLFAVAPLVTAQRVANLVARDEHGSTNSSFTAMNVLAMVLGAGFWALIVIGTVMSDTGPETVLE